MQIVIYTPVFALPRKGPCSSETRVTEILTIVLTYATCMEACCQFTVSSGIVSMQAVRPAWNLQLDLIAHQKSESLNIMHIASTWHTSVGAHVVCDIQSPAAFGSEQQPTASSQLCGPGPCDCSRLPASASSPGCQSPRQAGAHDCLMFYHFIE